MVRAVASLITAFTILWATQFATATVVIDTVLVGDEGNPSDQVYAYNNPNNEALGSVPYAYRIGTYEVTNSQYAEFLNAKARDADPLLLYNDRMGSEISGGISRSGDPGDYVYAVKENMGNKPVNFVNCYDAYRFVNWLHNGQGSGDTETGAYTLGAYNPGGYPVDASTIVRNPGASWFIPNENEWYKAAYYDPRTAAEGGPPGDDHYWYAATQSDTVPLVATADAFGNISNPGANVANTDLGADWNGQDGNVTTVGSAGPLSASYYGTYDQAGNVWEWVDTQFEENGWGRGLRGGAWNLNPFNTPADLRNIAKIATGSYPYIGFRVAAPVTAVPEPSSLVLAAVGIVGLCCVAKRRRRS